MKRFSLYLSILLGLTTLIGVMYGLDQRWAKADEVQQLSIRLEQKILEDRQFSIKKRIWQLEDRYGSNSDASCPPEIRDEIRNLKQDLQKIENDLKLLHGKE